MCWLSAVSSSSVALVICIQINKQSLRLGTYFFDEIQARLQDELFECQVLAYVFVLFVITLVNVHFVCINGVKDLYELEYRTNIRLVHVFQVH